MLIKNFTINIRLIYYVSAIDYKVFNFRYELLSLSLLNFISTSKRKKKK
jgi:hypothetical protein